MQEELILGEGGLIGIGCFRVRVGEKAPSLIGRFQQLHKDEVRLESPACQGYTGVDPEGPAGPGRGGPRELGPQRARDRRPRLLGTDAIIGMHTVGCCGTSGAILCMIRTLHFI